jgi:hypothetical protein
LNLKFKFDKLEKEKEQVAFLEQERNFLNLEQEIKTKSKLNKDLVKENKSLKEYCIDIQAHYNFKKKTYTY